MLAFLLTWDIHHILFVAIPMLVLTGLAQLWVKSAYAKYSETPASSGITGAQAAAGILREAGISDVRIEQVDGHLSDHYDPRGKVLRLSPRNFGGRSIAAVGIAAHEAGHAIQHARSYAPLVLRNLAVPLASVGSGFGYVAIIIGLLLSAGRGVHPIAIIGLALLASIVVFQLVNLPVEFNASRRALQILPSMGILTPRENRDARIMLTAAAMTYVAATVAAIAELLYWAWRLGLLGSRRD